MSKIMICEHAKACKMNGTDVFGRRTAHCRHIRPHPHDGACDSTCKNAEYAHLNVTCRSNSLRDYAARILKED